MLNEIPCLPYKTIDSFKNMDFIDIAIKIISEFIGDLLSGDKLQQIVNNALNFEIPVEYITNNDYLCYLYLGPGKLYSTLGRAWRNQ